MLDLDQNRPVATPRPAATIILLRDARRDSRTEVELCVMQRSVQSSFMGGAVVFPGGRVEAHDAGTAWEGLFTTGSGDWWDVEGVAARIAACREALEEVGVAPILGLNDPTESIAGLRKVESGDALRGAMRALGARLDLASLVPLSRWLTPEAEQRRFDARFFLAKAPAGLEPVSDNHEATRVYWASPSALLADYEKGAISLFPPTHRTLELLVGARDVTAALSTTSKSTLETICPRFLVEAGTPVLALPGDPAHEVKFPRIVGGSRYVLHEGRWISRNADG